MTNTIPLRTHGGADALGTPKWDFSTNMNTVGACPQTKYALATVDTAQYPDPNYTALRTALAAWHHVDTERVLIGSSASEWIARLTAYAANQTSNAAVWLPKYHYGDYSHMAQVHGMQHTTDIAQADLIWLCAPSSPLGQVQTLPPNWQQKKPNAITVLDCAYAPLQLTQTTIAPELHAHDTWQLFTPNKALGLCGIRAAYAIAPENTALETIQAIAARAPSWAIGAHGVALLHSWVQASTQSWLAKARETLQDWKAQHINMLQGFNWHIEPSETHFFVAQPPLPAQTDMATWLAALRQHDIKLRDCASFGLADKVRLCAHTPQAQAALKSALQHIG